MTNVFETKKLVELHYLK